MSFLNRSIMTAGAGILLLSVYIGTLPAQSSKSKTKSKGGATSVKALDARVEKLEKTLFSEVVEISTLYEDAGQYDRAKSLLDVLMKLNPNLPGLKEKLDRLESKAFDAQEIEYVMDTSKSWVSVGAAAARGKPVRVEVDGEYKFQYGATLTADGITSDQAGSDYYDSIPMGALIAVVVSNGKPGKPHVLKPRMQWTPQEDGLVMLKINAPTGQKSTGKLTVKMSGLVRAERSE